jgi:pantoate--beta-alanine ligase
VITQPEIVEHPDRMRFRIEAARAGGRRVGFVPTMGALHAGHASLVEHALRDCDDVAVSIFVNPTQFGPREDFDRYPRPRDADVALLSRLGVRWIYGPPVAAVYPPGDTTRVVVGGPAERFEGTCRPGHFAGVATVVCKLFLAVPAHAAYFGAKDWQQTRVVRRMTLDLGLPVRIVVCPTVREPDGLALSSRNAYLSAADRHRAVVLSAALRDAAAAWSRGDEPAAIERAMSDLMAAAGVAVEYAALADPDTLEPLAGAATQAVALVAGRLGATRLIDALELPARSALAGGVAG